jgi:choline dehydrogenase-like flavoprotein
LARAGFNPLLLEAGSGRAALGLTARIRGFTVAKFKRSLCRRGDLTMTGDPAAELFEELAPGGLSNYWACAVPRFSPDDFADGVRAGEAYAWPVRYEELVPWYERVEPLLHIAGPAEDVAALPRGRVSTSWRLGRDWAAVVREAAVDGRDVVAMPYAYGAETTMTRAATPFNSFTRLVRPREQAGELSVRYGAFAVQLAWSSTERKVTAVVCRDACTGAETRIPCRAVVLAAGAVNSAQILMQSATPDFPEGLGNTHGVLGRYLHDHPLAKIVLELGRRVPVAPASYVTRPPLDRTSPLYAAAYMQWAGSLAMARSLVTGGRTRTLGFSIFGTMIPTPEDRITLDGRAGRNGRSALRLALRYPPAAINVLEQARRDLIALLGRAGWEPRERVFRIEAPGNSVHYGGTCRMHASPRFGVVDGRSRVHGIRNVVVADSSVFTTGPEKNPVLTAMALAARASDRLAEEMRSGDI